MFLDNSFAATGTAVTVLQMQVPSSCMLLDGISLTSKTQQLGHVKVIWLIAMYINRSHSLLSS